MLPGNVLPVGAARQRHHGAQRGGPLAHLHLELQRRNRAQVSNPGLRGPTRGAPPPGRSTRGDPPGGPPPGRSTWGAPPGEIHPGRSRASESAIQSQWAGPWGSTSVFADLAAPVLRTLAAGYCFLGGNFQRLSSTHLVTVGGLHYGFRGGPGTGVRPVRHNPWGHSLELLWKAESGEVS